MYWEIYNWVIGGCSVSDVCFGCLSGYSCIVGVFGVGCVCGKWVCFEMLLLYILVGSVIEVFLWLVGVGYFEFDILDDLFVLILVFEVLYFNCGIEVFVINVIDDGYDEIEVVVWYDVCGFVFVDY